jgi:hypothetical protein
MTQITFNRIALALALASTFGLALAACKHAARDCGSSPECAEGGYCTARDGICLAASDADCADSRECRVKGACQARDGYCQALSADSCQGSQVCKRYGWCTSKGGACTAAGDPDCQRSEGCKAAGWCTAVNGMCMLANETDCRQAGLCAKDVRCAIVDGRCVPADAAARSAGSIDAGQSDDEQRNDLMRQMEEAAKLQDAQVDNQDGVLDTNETRQVIARHRAEVVRRCLDPLAASQPAPAATRFRLNATIAPNGRVSAVNVEGGGAETAAARSCLAAQARTWVFPAGADVTKVAWVLNYQPAL